MLQLKTPPGTHVPHLDARGHGPAGKSPISLFVAIALACLVLNKFVFTTLLTNFQLQRLGSFSSLYFGYFGRVFLNLL